MGYPCIVKPVMSSSGKGQSKIDGPRMCKNLGPPWPVAREPRPRDRRGLHRLDYEITQLTVRSVGADGPDRHQLCDPIGHVQVSGDYVESWQPTPCTRQRSKIAPDRQGRDRQPWRPGRFGVELFVKGENVTVQRSESAPARRRPGHPVHPKPERVELHARAILGLPVDTSLRNPGASAVIYGGVKPGHRV